MKKVIYLSIFAFMVSCNGSDTSSREDQQHQTFVPASAARTGEDLTPEQEKHYITEAMEILKQDRESELKGSGARKPQILCHSDYSAASGHACVMSNGYLVEVTWNPEFMGGPGPGWYDMTSTVYDANITASCRC